REIGNRRGVRADIATLVVEELIFDGEQAALVIDGGPRLVTLLARMIGRDQMLATILDPFHRTAEPQRGERNQHVLGIKLAANADSGERPASNSPGASLASSTGGKSSTSMMTRSAASSAT